MNLHIVLTIMLLKSCIINADKIKLKSMEIKDFPNITKIITLPRNTNEGLSMVIELKQKVTSYFLHMILSSRLPKVGPESIIMDRVIDICANLKKLKGSDILYTLLYQAFSTRTNISTFCPLDAGIYGFFNFKLDEDRIPLQIFRTKYIFSLVGSWYSLMKVKGSKRPMKVNMFYLNASFQLQN